MFFKVNWFFDDMKHKIEILKKTLPAIFISNEINTLTFVKQSVTSVSLRIIRMIAPGDLNIFLTFKYYVKDTTNVRE